MTDTPAPADLAGLIAGKLIERRNVKAIATRNERLPYMPHCSCFPHRCKNENMEYPRPCSLPWTRADIDAHINGSKTFGHYLVSDESKCRCFVLDVDLNEHDFQTPPQLVVMHGPTGLTTCNPRELWCDRNEWTLEWRKLLAFNLRCLTDALARTAHELLGIQTLVTYSGNKGMHVIGVLEPGTPADDARVLATEVLDDMGGFRLVRGNNFYEHEMYPEMSIELFPKQAKVNEGGLGNLVRLPLGIHLKSGRPSWFVDMGVTCDVTRPDDPALALTHGSVR